MKKLESSFENVTIQESSGIRIPVHDLNFNESFMNFLVV